MWTVGSWKSCYKNIFTCFLYMVYFSDCSVISAFNDNYAEFESNGDKEKMLLIEEYLYMIKPYLIKIKNDHKTRNEWKIQLAMEISFNSSKEFKETCTTYTKSNNINIIIVK